MKNDDLDKTKSLDDILNSGEEKNAYEEYDNLFREKKYSDLQETLDAATDLDDKEVDENGDIIEEQPEPEPVEILDVESIPNNDMQIKEDVKKVLKGDKEDKPRIKLTKKAKIIIASVIGVILVTVLVIVLVLVFKKGKKNVNDGVVQDQEDIIVVKDNYIYKNGTLSFIDEDEKEIGTYTCKNEDEKLCHVAFQGNNEDTFYKVTNTYEDDSIINKRVSLYFGKYAFIYDNETESDGSVVLYDFKGNREVSSYQLVKTYKVDDKDYVIVKTKDAKYEMYEISAQGLLPCIVKDYKYLGIMEDKKEPYVIAKLSAGYYLLDFEGSEVSKLIGKNIVNYDDKYIVTEEKGIYSLYTYDNVQKMTGYKFINLESGFITLVDDENKLYYRDKDLVKVNEKGFELNNDIYLPVKVYSNEGVLRNSNYAYQTTVSDNSITVAIKDDNLKNDYFKNISLKEYEYNKSIQYYNYLDGILYFYKDEAKEELIGNYVCKNKNEEFKTDELLANCRPALDTVFEDNDMTFDNGRVSMIPIYNNKYVFIYDGTTNNPSVKLYDLVSEKELGNYESVNTYTTSNKGVLNVVTVDSVNVICKNKNSKYGMINISKDSVTPVYTFDYGSMEMMSGKVLALDNMNKWVIVYSKTSTSPQFEGKIRGYIGNISYYKVKNNDKYSVYDASAVLVSNDTYKYVELYTNFYAGVDNDNKLMLYNYDGQELIDKKIQLYSTNYYGNESNSFMVAASGSKAVVEVLKDGSYNSIEKNLGVKKEPEPEPEPIPEPEPVPVPEIVPGDNENEESGE